MKSTRRRTRNTPARASATVDEFEELRDVFHARLQGEHLNFVMLSAALAQADQDAARIFAELKFRAHRLHGGAAVFDMAAVAAAAEALERAAVAALVSHADNADAAVWTAISGLVQLIDGLQAHRDGPLAKAG